MTAKTSRLRLWKKELEFNVEIAQLPNSKLKFTTNSNTPTTKPLAHSSSTETELNSTNGLAKSLTRSKYIKWATWLLATSRHAPQAWPSHSLYLLTMTLLTVTLLTMTLLTSNSFSSNSFSSNSFSSNS